MQTYTQLTKRRLRTFLLYLAASLSLIFSLQVHAQSLVNGGEVSGAIHSTNV